MYRHAPVAAAPRNEPATNPQMSNTEPEASSSSTTSRSSGSKADRHRPPPLRKRRLSQMASVSTTTATMAAAAGFDKRSSTSSSFLQTPGSGSFPSESMSPVAANSPSFLKRDELRTPITPPSAYLDFLKNMSPAVLSPAPTSAGMRFPFGEKLSDKISSATIDQDSDRAMLSPPMSVPPTSQPVQPALSRNSSYESAASTASSASASSGGAAESIHSNASSNRANSISTASRKRPESPRVIIPPSPFAKPAQPGSARTPRRLHIPGSPFSQQQHHQQHNVPGSAQSIPSPYSTTPASAATPWSASFASQDPGSAIDPMLSKPGRVAIRQVVTRTVTYCRSTPSIDPAPKGKRRRIDVSEPGSATPTATATTTSFGNGGGAAAQAISSPGKKSDGALSSRASDTGDEEHEEEMRDGVSALKQKRNKVFSPLPSIAAITEEDSGVDSTKTEVKVEEKDVEMSSALPASVLTATTAPPMMGGVDSVVADAVKAA